MAMQQNKKRKVTEHEEEIEPKIKLSRMLKQSKTTDYTVIRRVMHLRNLLTIRESSRNMYEYTIRLLTMTKNIIKK